MAKDGKTINMMAKRQLHELNWADYKLYEYFTRKLDREGNFSTYLPCAYYYAFVSSEGPWR